MMTHHLPTIKCNNPFYPDSHCGFCTDLEKYIKDPILCWIYGHTHSNILMSINNVMMLSNQWGYDTEIKKFILLLNI